MENSLSTRDSSMKRSSNVIRPVEKSSPPKNIFKLPNNQYYMQSMGKVHSLQSFPRDFGGQIILKDIVNRYFEYADLKWLSQNFEKVTLGKKGRERGGEG
jgi:hypothetical protein